MLLMGYKVVHDGAWQGCVCELVDWKDGVLTVNRLLHVSNRINTSWVVIYFFLPLPQCFKTTYLNDLNVSALTIIIAYRRCVNQSALPCGGKKKRWRRKWSREHTEKSSCNTKMVRRRWSLQWMCQTPPTWVCQSDLAIHIPQYFSLPVTSWERIWFCSLKCLFHFSRPDQCV